MKTKKILYAAAAAAIVLAAVFAASCKGPADLIAGVEDTVKAANDKFLVVKSTNPTPQFQTANPGGDIIVQFDRDILETTIEENVVIEKSSDGTRFENYVTSYTPATRTLKIEMMGGSLDGDTTYTVKLLQGLHGADGSQLQEPFVWAFKTMNVISGTFWFGEPEDVDEPLSYANIALQTSQAGTTVPVTIKINGATNPAGITYSLTASDSTEDWRSITDLEIERDFDMPDEGPKTLYLRVALGEYSSESTSRTIIVDRIAPAAPGVPDLNYQDDTGSSNADNYTKNTTGLTFSGTAENGATVTVRRAPNPAGTPYTVMGTASSNGNYILDNQTLSAGNYNISAFATDAAGNPGPSSTATAVYVDTTAPTGVSASIDYDTYASTTAGHVRGTRTISASASDNTAIDYIQFLVDGASLGNDSSSPYSLGWNTTTYSAGSHSVSVRVYDRAGNFTNLTTALTRTVDNTAPSFDLGSTIYRNASYTFAPTITEANPYAYSWTYSGGTLTFGTPAAASTTASCTGDGARTVTLTVTDLAGNRISDSVTFGWDTTAPTPPGVTGTVIAYEQILWTWSAGSDALSGLSGYYRYGFDAEGLGSEVTATQAAFSNGRFRLILPGGTSVWEAEPLYNDGAHTCSVQEKDNVGNWSASAVGSVNVTTSPILPAPGSTGTNKIAANWPNYPLATGYRFYVRTAGGTYGTPLVFANSETSLQPLAAGTTYKWKYEAYNAKYTLYTSPEFSYTTN